MRKQSSIDKRYLLAVVMGLFFWYFSAMVYGSFSSNFNDAVGFLVLFSGIILVVLVVFSFGMGWRSFGMSMATVVWFVLSVWFAVFMEIFEPAICNDPNTICSGGPPILVEYVVMVFLGLALTALLSFVWPAVCCPARTSFIVWKRAGWLHRAHAALLVLVMWLCLGALVFLAYDTYTYVIDIEEDVIWIY